jgi:hypothetical protein
MTKIRILTFDLDGMDLKYSPLLIGQMEAYAEASRAIVARTEAAEAKLKKAREEATAAGQPEPESVEGLPTLDEMVQHNAQFVTISLNNALGLVATKDDIRNGKAPDSKNGIVPWTLDRIRAELDGYVYNEALPAEIRKAMRLRVERPAAVKQPGENAATSAN